MKDKIAEIISLVFNPIAFITFMPFLIVYKQTGDGLYALKWELFSVGFIIIGLVLLFIGRIKGTFSDFELSKKEERSIYFYSIWILALSYVASTFFFKGLFFSISIASIGILIGVILFAVMNKYMKASIHTGVASAFAVTSGLLYGITPAIIVFFAIPLIGWSRVVLRRHTLREVIVGGVLGIIVVLITFLLGRYIFSVYQ